MRDKIAIALLAAVLLGTYLIAVADLPFPASIIVVSLMVSAVIVIVHVNAFVERFILPFDAILAEVT